MAKKSIVIITSGQPSANPRAVKEALALSAAGYSISVIYVPLSPWADEFDRQLFSSNTNIKWINAGYHPQSNPIKYRLVRLRRKLHELMFRYAGKLMTEAQHAYVLFSQELESRAVRMNASLFIAHNLGALPAAVKAAKKWNAAAVFDAEDFHRGESSESSLEYEMAKRIEDKYLKGVNSLTAASPLIEKAYQRLYPNLSTEVINNVFSIRFLAKESNAEHKRLSLFWFSQTIGKDRGLEDICKAMDLSANPAIKLFLLGSCTDEMKNYLRGCWQKNPAFADNLSFIPPCHPDELFGISAQYDIGLALEQHISLNREYCLTNKIFTYLLSGNTIIASDTEAQKKFLSENPEAGYLYESGNIQALSQLINRLYEERAIVYQNRSNILSMAKRKFNFELESVKIKGVVASAIK